MERENKLQLVHRPQVGYNANFILYLDTVEEATEIAKVLWQYDLFQYENNIKPDYSNATFLNVWDEEEQDWITWYNDDGYDWNEIIDMENEE